MAELRAENVTFRLKPLGFEFPGEEWIRSDLSLLLAVNRQRLLIQPKHTPTLSLQSYQKLLVSARDFLDSCATEFGDLFDDTEPFVFVPPELNFELALLDTDLSTDGEGEVTIRVMIRVDETSSASIGSTFSVDTSQFRWFLNTLEEEIEQIVRQRTASAFVVAEV